MKSFGNLSKHCFGGLLAAALSLVSISATHGQVFVANNNNGTIGEYNFDGTPINTSLISLQPLSGPTGLVISGSNLYVITSLTGMIGEYTTSGTTVGASLVSGLTADQIGIAVSGSNLFITNGDLGTISEYTTSGTMVNPSLISGLNSPTAIAASGSHLFVANAGTGTIGEYNLDGTTVNASLISGLNLPTGIAVSGSNLFVTNYNGGTIGEYTTSGATVNASLISGLSNPTCIAVSGSNLFVTYENSGEIGEYTTSGTTVSDALISGLSSPVGIAVEPLPQSFSDWENSYNISGAATDTPENDGVPNLLKYLYDIDPTVPMISTDRAALPVPGTTVVGNTTYLTLTYRQYALETGITVKVQTSSDLKTWSDDIDPNDQPTPTGLTDAATSGNDPFMQVRVPLTGPRQFIRLNVTLP